MAGPIPSLLPAPPRPENPNGAAQLDQKPPVLGEQPEWRGKAEVSNLQADFDQNVPEGLRDSEIARQTVPSPGAPAENLEEQLIFLLLEALLQNLADLLQKPGAGREELGGTLFSNGAHLSNHLRELSKGGRTDPGCPVLPGHG